MSMENMGSGWPSFRVADRPRNPTFLVWLAAQIIAGPTCQKHLHEALADRFFSVCAAYKQ